MGVVGGSHALRDPRDPRVPLTAYGCSDVWVLAHECAHTWSDQKRPLVRCAHQFLYF